MSKYDVISENKKSHWLYPLVLLICHAKVTEELR